MILHNKHHNKRNTWYAITLSETNSTFDYLMANALENIVGKRENAGYQHFLIFPQYFSIQYEQIMDKSKMLFGKELTKQ